MIQTTLSGGRAYWVPVLDGHPVALQLADRHYSRKNIGAPLMMGPGEKIVLISPSGNAVFAWRKTKYREDGQEGIECSIFRNEGPELSSFLIAEAEKYAWMRWPGTRLFTYINPKKIRSTNPGHCFLMAGWSKAGTNKDGKLIILEKFAQKDTLEDGEVRK